MAFQLIRLVGLSWNKKDHDTNISPMPSSAQLSIIYKLREKKSGAGDTECKYFRDSALKNDTKNGP